MINDKLYILKEKLINYTIKKMGIVKPVNTLKLNDSFTIHKNLLIFWYNDSINSTHIVCGNIKTKKIIEHLEHKDI